MSPEVTDLLTTLRNHGVEVIVVDDLVRVTPAEALTPALAELVLQHEDELLVELDPRRMTFTERAERLIRERQARRFRTKVEVVADDYAR